jgi:predicted transcriptional regulator
MSASGLKGAEKSKEKSLKEFSSEFRRLLSIKKEKDEIYDDMRELVNKLDSLEEKEIEEMKENNEFGHAELMRECVNIIERLREDSGELYRYTENELELIEKISRTEKGPEKLEKDLTEKRDKLNG